MGSANLDTVLGLSMTPTTAGWVLVAGHDADGTILDHDDFQVRTGSGVRAVNTADQVATAVLRAQASAAESEQRLHLLGVTWSDDAAAEASLLVESLTNTGFDNVVPVRRLEAIDALARGIAPIIGYDKTAVCVLERASASVVLVGTGGGATRTTVKHVPDGTGGLAHWLTTMFDRSRWQPESVVVVGPAHQLDAVTPQLEMALPVPVLTQAGAELALARGAALASVQRTHFSDARTVATRTAKQPARRGRSRPRSYAGGLTMLGAGTATLVASVSLLVGLRVAPEKTTRPVEPVAQTSPTPSAAEAVAPVAVPSAIVGTVAAQTALAPPPAAEPPSAPPAGEAQAEPGEPRADVPSAGPVVTPPSPQPNTPPESHERPPLLTRLLERMQGLNSDTAP